MSKSFLITLNVFLFAGLIVLVDGIELIAGTEVFSLIVGGVILGVVALIVEPVLVFFKFPTNFWGLTLVGFILNFITFLLFNNGFIPGIVKITSGTFGKGYSPLPFFRLELNNAILVAIVAALLLTLLQILLKRLSRR